MTTTTAAARGVGSGFAVLCGLLDAMPPLPVRRVEVTGALLDDSRRPGADAQTTGTEVHVHVTHPDDAPTMAAHFGLTAYRSHRSPAAVLDGEYVHRAWTGTVPTPVGPVRVRVSSCEYLPPPLAALTTTPNVPAAPRDAAAMGAAA